MSKSVWFFSGIALAVAVFLFFRSFENDTGINSAGPVAASSNGIKNEARFQDWHDFTPPSGKFRIKFPTLPQHATEKLDDPDTKEPRQYEMYVSEAENGTVHMISVITMLDQPNITINEEVLSKVVKDLMANNPKGKIKDIKMSKYQNYPSLDFSLENEEVNIDGQAILVANTLYLLTTLSKAENPQKEEHQYFLNSFNLLDLK